MTHIPIPETRDVLDLGPFTDREVADELGVSTSTVYRWRMGRSVPAIGYVRDLYAMHLDYQREFANAMKSLDRKLGFVRQSMAVDASDNGGYRGAR